MGGGNDLVEREPERWDVPCPEPNLAQLDRLEGDGVNVQCINSSEFVVGKQTNFNAPVTIINCDSAVNLGQPLDILREEGREKIVIRDKVLSKSAAMTVQKVAGQSEKADSTAGNSSTGKSERWRCSRRKPWSKASLVATTVFLVFLVTTAIPLGILLPPKENADKSDKSETPAGCILIPRKGGDMCLFSTPALAAWDIPKDLTPIELPVPFVVVAQTHEDECYFVQQCFKVLEDFRLEGKNTTWCNFFVGGDGNLYEGLGWETKNSIGGPAEGKNVCLCFVGDFFELDFPTYPQVEGTKALIEYGVRIDRISKNYTLMASNAIKPTDHLFQIYNIIKKWPNFKNPFGSVIVPFDFVVDESPQEPRHKIYSKREWRGLPPTSSVEMKLPVPYAVISHSVTPRCFDLESCSPIIRSMQRYHLSLLYTDIAYNFLVDSSGNIYEGRGWTKRNVKGGMYKGRNININFIGDFSLDVAPTPEQLKATEFLLEKGVQEGNLAQNYLLISDNSTFATLSPGKNVYAEIKCWPHFVNDPEQHERQFHER